MNRSFRFRWLAVASLMFALGAAGCSSDTTPDLEQNPGEDGTEPLPGGPDDGNGNGNGNGTGGSGLPTVPTTPPVPGCRIDDDCSNGFRCDDTTKTCIAAKSCTSDANCQYFIDGAEYCEGTECRCAVATGETTGYCHRRRAPCEECTTDSQCGTGANFEAQGACRALSGDTSGKKYCLQQQVGPTCECGFVPDGTEGFCRPASNTCSGTGCTANSDCGLGQVCNVAACLCEQSCRWNFQTKKTDPACADGMTCWVDGPNLDPQSKTYGQGRCRAPCTSDGQCTDPNTNLFASPDLVCAPEELADGGPTPNRCRPDGECMDSFECPEQPLGAIYKGYCDREARTCELDCRVGIDPVTGFPYQDCRDGYGCQDRGGVRTCVERSCADLGGAELACSDPLDMCCGSDWNSDGSAAAESATCQGKGKPNGCFQGPKDVFCKTCTSQEDCAGLVGPSGSTLKSICYGFENPDTGEQVGLCTVPTTDNFARDEFFVPQASKGCAKGFSATEIPLIFNPNYGTDGDYNQCTSDDDCNVGHTAGRCAPIPGTERPDGSAPKVCLCDGAGVQCPGTPDAPVGFCRSGTGLRACLESVVCMPGTAAVFGNESAPGCFGQ